MQNSGGIPHCSPVLKPFYPALDGLRALAFLAVFLTHYGVVVCGWPILQWGWAGVDVFFVLSGFLITGILYDTLHRRDFFRNFYIRRTLRIFPLFYGFWLLMLLLTPVLKVAWNRYDLAVALYIGNFFRAGGMLGLHANPELLKFLIGAEHGHHLQFEIGPLWSLCVEEQFYLVWPAVVWAVRSRRKLLVICATVIVVEPFLRELYWHLWPSSAQAGAIYFNTFTRIDTLLMGAAIALWLRGPHAPEARVRGAAYVFTLAPLPVLALLVHGTHAPPMTGWTGNHVVATIGLTLIAFFSAGLLMLAALPGTWLYRALRIAPLTYIGRISYGLYFFHALPINIFINLGLASPQHHYIRMLFLPITFAYAFLAAWLSFRYLESPFLRLKDRLAPRPGAVNDPPPVAV
jgi:peptidoglycan/LPS O-acetylase OafA/YrhL